MRTAQNLNQNPILRCWLNGTSSIRRNQTISLYSFDAMGTGLVRQFDRLGDEKIQMQVLGQKNKVSSEDRFFSTLSATTLFLCFFSWIPCKNRHRPRKIFPTAPWFYRTDWSCSAKISN